ncbi:phospholipase D/nuclease, partial [Artomyces pyxidatus]
IDDDEARFQADIQRALEASKADNSQQSPRTSLASLSTDSRSGTPPSSRIPVSIATSEFVSERAKMEQERLARAKRMRGDDDQVLSIAEPPRKRRTPSDNPSTSQAGVASSSKSTAHGDANIYWDGELRQTANRYVEFGENGENGKPVWRLSEIIGDRSQVELAIISSYALQQSWIHGFFAPSTPVVLVTQPVDSGSGNASVKEILPNWIRVTPFLRGGRGVMHMKIFYKSGRLRIAVSTANLVEIDWRDIENTVWVQDVPRRSSPIAHDSKASDFPATFEYVLKSLNVEPALMSLVQNDHPNIPFPSLKAGALRTAYDFSRVRARLIPSIAGKHEGWPKVIRVGHTSLMKAVDDMIGQSKKASNKVTLECQGSSIGTYSTQWLNEIYGSAGGVSPEKWLDEPKSRRAKLPLPNIKILFPTHDWVLKSVLGERGGGTMFCRRSQWEGAKFPRELFHQSKSKRGRVLMHSKMMIATFSQPIITNSGSVKDGRDDGSNTESDSDDDIIVLDDKGKDRGEPQKQIIGWAYVGSHNFTPSAWGNLSGSGFTPIMNITNYELGVVFPLHGEDEMNAVSCYERPPRKYRTNDLPWVRGCFFRRSVGSYIPYT